jgi:hypothetical protein
VAFDESSLPLDDAGLAPDELGAADAGEALDDAPEQPEHPLVTAGYWAALEGAEFIAGLLEEESEYERVVIDTGLVAVWRLAYAALYSQNPQAPGTFDTIQIATEGDHGDQLRFRVDEPASLLRQQVTMATGQRAAFQAVAINTDAATLAMAANNDAAVDYFYRREMPDSKEREQLESCRGYGAGYAWWRWDKWAGEDVEVGVDQVPALVPDPSDPTGKTSMPSPDGATAPLPLYGPSGAPVALVLNPWEVRHNVRQRGKHLWRCAHERRSKYELMALHPEIAEQLSGMNGELTQLEQLVFGTVVTHGDDDLIVRHFYHVPMGDPNDPQNPLRAGRYVVVCGDLILPGQDGRLPVTRKVGMPIAEMMSRRFRNLALGYSDWWGTLAAQQGKDQVISDMLSNVTLFGRANAFKDPETEMDLDTLAAGGGVFVKGANEQAPGFMNPPQMSQAAPYIIDYANKAQQAITGLNDVTRGNPGSNITSGEMAALFTNLSVEFNSDTQMTVDEARRQSANIIVDLIMLNAEYEMLVQIVGVDERPYLTKFRTQQLRGIRTVEMQTVTPMMRSSAGRMQLWNLIKDVDPAKRAEAVMLITTGQWRQLTQTDSAEYIRIKWENEQLAQGKPCQVSTTDDPYKHIPQHVKLFNELSQDPERNKTAIATALKHIQESLAAYYTVDPMMAAMLRFQPPPAPNKPAAATDQNAKPGDQKPGDPNAAPLPKGDGSAQAPDRLGSKLPMPARPPAGAPV